MEHKYTSNMFRKNNDNINDNNKTQTRKNSLKIKGKKNGNKKLDLLTIVGFGACLVLSVIIICLIYDEHKGSSLFFPCKVVYLIVVAALIFLEGVFFYNEQNCWLKTTLMIINIISNILFVLKVYSINTILYSLYLIIFFKQNKNKKLSKFSLFVYTLIILLLIYLLYINYDEFLFLAC